MSTNKSRITDNQGIRTGFGENTGLSMGESYKAITQTTGTVSVVPRTQFAYYNLNTALTGNVAINVNATYSLINDQMTILASFGSTTASVAADTTSNVKFTTITGSNKVCAIQLIYNGTNYIGFDTAL